MTANCVSWKKNWIWNHQGVENFRHQRRKGNHNELILWWERFGAIATFHVVSPCGDQIFLEPYLQASQCFERNWKTWVTWHFPGIKLSLNGLMARFLFTMKIHDDLGLCQMKVPWFKGHQFHKHGKTFRHFRVGLKQKSPCNKPTDQRRVPGFFLGGLCKKKHAFLHHLLTGRLICIHSSNPT